MGADGEGRVDHHIEDDIQRNLGLKARGDGLGEEVAGGGGRGGLLGRGVDGTSS